MSSENQSKEFNDLFFKRYDELFNQVASSSVTAATETNMTDEERKKVFKTNAKTIVLMSNVYRKEEEVFNNTGKFPNEL